jgi:hypothetical protein
VRISGFGFRPAFGFRVLLKVSGLAQAFGFNGFRVSGFGFRVSSSGLRVSGFGFRVQGFGFRVSGLGFWVSGFGFRDGDAFRIQGSVGSREGGSLPADILDDGIHDVEGYELARGGGLPGCQLG